MELEGELEGELVGEMVCHWLVVRSRARMNERGVIVMSEPSKKRTRLLAGSSVAEVGPSGMGGGSMFRWVNWFVLRSSDQIWSLIAHLAG